MSQSEVFMLFDLIHSGMSLPPLACFHNELKRVEQLVCCSLQTSIPEVRGGSVRVPSEDCCTLQVVDDWDKGEDVEPRVQHLSLSRTNSTKEPKWHLYSS